MGLAFKPSSKIFYWPFQGGTSFVDLLCFFCLVFAMLLWASVNMCLVVTCWERAGLLALVCGVQLGVCHFPIGILGQVWYLIISIPDLCTLTYFFQLEWLKLHNTAFLPWYVPPIIWQSLSLLPNSGSIRIATAIFIKGPKQTKDSAPETNKRTEKLSHSGPIITMS